LPIGISNGVIRIEKDSRDRVQPPDDTCDKLVRVIRPFRFGLQLGLNEPDRDPVAHALQAEEAGFDVVLVGDHIGPEYAPLIALGAIAHATTRCRIGTLVLNADVRNPVQLAWEAITLDLLSGGRFELGVGAGHTPQEYSAMGMAQDPAMLRKRRLAENVETIRRLLDGDHVTLNGTHHRLEDAHVGRSVQARLPILVGGNGAELLTHAGAHADIVGLQGLGRTLDDGHRHEVRWTTDWLDIQLEQIRTGAGDRFDQVELNALVQIVQITDDRDVVIGSICDRAEGLTPADVKAIPYVLVGTVTEIIDQLHQCRERWGISYFAVRDLDSFAPVIDALGTSRA
jgi:probable F420-dependent oxidoreductase